MINICWMGLGTDFEKEAIELTIPRYLDPLGGPVKREAKYLCSMVLYSEVGDKHYASKSFQVWSDIKQVNQWFAMNKSNSLEEWKKSAMRMRSIISFNGVYADKEDNIFIPPQLFLSSPKEVEGS